MRKLVIGMGIPTQSQINIVFYPDADDTSNTVEEKFGWEVYASRDTNEVIVFAAGLLKSLADRGEEIAVELFLNENYIPYLPKNLGLCFHRGKNLLSNTAFLLS